MEKIGRSVRCVGGRGRGINVGYLRLGVLSSGEVLAKGLFFWRGLVRKKKGGGVVPRYLMLG